MRRSLAVGLLLVAAAAAAVSLLAWATTDQATPTAPPAGIQDPAPALATRPATVLQSVPFRREPGGPAIRDEFGENDELARVGQQVTDPRGAGRARQRAVGAGLRGGGPERVAGRLLRLAARRKPRQAGARAPRRARLPGDPGPGGALAALPVGPAALRRRRADHDGRAGRLRVRVRGLRRRARVLRRARELEARSSDWPTRTARSGCTRTPPDHGSMPPSRPESRCRPWTWTRGWQAGSTTLPLGPAAAPTTPPAFDPPPPPEAGMPPEAPADSVAWCRGRFVITAWTITAGPERRPPVAGEVQLHRTSGGACAGVGMEGLLTFRIDLAAARPGLDRPARRRPADRPALLEPVHLRPKDPEPGISDGAGLVIRDGTVFDPEVGFPGHSTCPQGQTIGFE